MGKWRESHVRGLISLWQENYKALQSNRKNAKIYNEIATELNKQYELSLNGSDVNLKIASLKKQYRLEKKKLSSGSPSGWWAFDIVHQIIGCEPVNDFSLLSDSLKDMSQDLCSNEEVSSQSRFAMGESSSIHIMPDNDCMCRQMMESPQDCNESDVVSTLDEDEQDEHVLKTKRKLSYACATDDERKQKKKRFTIESAILKHLEEEKLFREEERINQCLPLFIMMGFCKNLLDEESRSISSILYQFSENTTRIFSKPESNDWFQNIYPTLSDHEFREHFRVCRSTFLFLVAELTPYISKKQTNMAETISVEKKIAVALHYLASSEEYRVVSSLFGIGISTANEIVHDFVKAVNSELLQLFVKFPGTKEKLKFASEKFEALHGFPQCIGAVDVCHIPVNPPKEIAVNYHNYKGWNSIVLLAVADAQYNFTYVNVGSPGRKNDSFILNNSHLGKILDSKLFDELRKDFNGVSVPVCLIGDSAFPLKRHLLKPYPEQLPLTDVQKHYNRVLCRSRRVIENSFERLKARFRILYKRMEVDIRFASEVIKACCVLHNVCEYLNDKCPTEWTEGKFVEQTDVQNISIAGNNGPGKEVRDAFANYLYNLRS